jgi:hypothetical protein
MANVNGRPVYALQNWSVTKRSRGWFIARTSGTFSSDRRRWKGPYSSVASATLMIARELGKELVKRHRRSE